MRNFTRNSYHLRHALGLRLRISAVRKNHVTKPLGIKEGGTPPPNAAANHAAVGVAGKLARFSATIHLNVCGKARVIVFSATGRPGARRDRGAIGSTAGSPVKQMP
jgi:hypothetical protein